MGSGEKRSPSPPPPTPHLPLAISLSPEWAWRARRPAISEYGQVDGAGVEGGEAGDPIEAGGRMVADIDGQLEAGDVRGGQLEGVAPARRGRGRGRGPRGSGRGRHLPRVAVGGLGQEQHRRGRRLAPGRWPTCQRAATNRPPARWLARMSSSERIPSSSGMSRLPVYVACKTARKSLSVVGPNPSQSSAGTSGPTWRGAPVARSR